MTNSEPALNIARDRSFWGLAGGQFLGAFNDNLFKQLVLLLCVERAVKDGREPSAYQWIALLLFALPWVLFSGLAGFIADRTSKQRGIVLYKALEIAITLAGVAAFLTDRLVPVLVVLFLLSTHSAFFGPNKYGILPELFRKRDLPQVNGVFQMMTFLAIIFGMALAGYGKQLLPGQSGLAQLSSWSVGIAIVGTLAVLAIRPTPIAQPGLAWSWLALGVSRETFQLLKSDPFLRRVLLMSSAFWFMGGVVQPSVNVLGKVELHLGDARTSLLAACLGIGIAAGCVLAGKLSARRVRFGVVRLGAWGMVLGLASLTALAFAARSLPVGSIPKESFGQMLGSASMIEWLSRAALIELGAAAGLFVVPLQVVLQVTPPESFKGRMIGTMNLINWLGILLSAVFVGAFGKLRLLANAASPGLELPPSVIFGALAVLALPIALLYRPADRELE